MTDQRCDHRIHTVCHACRGARGRMISRQFARVGVGEIVTRGEPRECPTCDGQGWLAELVPPV